MLNPIPVRVRNVLSIFLFRVMFVLLVAGCAAQEAEGRPDHDAGLGPYRALGPFYRALRQAESGRGRVAVVQVGDSHTANDAFSGRMRELLQGRFGDGGRGMLPPGIPHAYYRPARVSVTSEGWRIVRGAGPVGLAGLRQRAEGPATMTLQAEPGELQRVIVEVLAQPGGGTVDIATADGRRVSASTAARVGAVRIAAPAGAGGWVEVSARGDGPVDLLGWTAEKAGAGATWSNLGTVGATMELTQRWDAGVLAAEGAALSPALVVLAFGTNEGFKDSTDLAAYPALARAAIRRLRAMAPGASIVVAGPPGGVRAGAGVPCGEGRSAVPANLPRVRAMLREAARAEGAFFWDWAEAMGGDCAIIGWARTEPPMAARDHVHLLVPGARRTAEALFEVLMQGYDRSPRVAGR